MSLLAVFVSALFLYACSGDTGGDTPITAGKVSGTVALNGGGDAKGILVIAEQTKEGVTTTAARKLDRSAAKVGDTFSAVTGDGGKFEFPSLPLGTYSFYARDDYRKGIKTGVKVETATVEGVDFTLDVLSCVTGKVKFLNADGTPASVAGAKAMLDGTTTVVDVAADGTFKFTTVAQAQYPGVTVKAAGFNDGHFSTFSTVGKTTLALPQNVSMYATAGGAGVRRTLAGVVISAVDEQPIAGAMVSLDNEQTAITSANGTYFFPNVTAGEHVISVTKEGFGAAYTEFVMKPVERLNTWSVNWPDDVSTGADMIAELLSRDIQWNYGDGILTVDGLELDLTSLSEAEISQVLEGLQDEDDSGSPATYQDFINLLMAKLPLDVTQAGTMNFFMTKSNGGIKGQIAMNMPGTTIPAAGANVKVYRQYDSSWDVKVTDNGEEEGGALDNDQAWGDFEDYGTSYDQDIDGFDGAAEYANESDIDETSSLYPYRILVAETTAGADGSYSVALTGGLTYRVEVYYKSGIFDGYHAHETLSVHSGDTITKNFVLTDSTRPYTTAVSFGTGGLLYNEGTLWAAETGGFNGSVSISFNEQMNTSYALLKDVELVVRDYNPGGIENTPNAGEIDAGEQLGTDNFGDADDSDPEENARNGHVAAAFTWSPDGKILTVTPAVALPAGYTYQVINLGDLEDLAGNNYNGKKYSMPTDGVAGSLDDTSSDSVENNAGADNTVDCSDGSGSSCWAWDFLLYTSHDRFELKPTLEFEVRNTQPGFVNAVAGLQAVKGTVDSEDDDFLLQWTKVEGDKVAAYNVYATLGDEMMKVYLGTLGSEKFIGLETTLYYEGDLDVVNAALTADGQPTLDDVYPWDQTLHSTREDGKWNDKQVKLCVTAVNKDGYEGAPTCTVVHDNLGPFIDDIGYASSSSLQEHITEGSDEAPYLWEKEDGPILGYGDAATNYNAWTNAYFLATSYLVGSTANTANERASASGYFVFQENLAAGGTMELKSGEVPQRAGFGGFVLNNVDDGSATFTRSLQSDRAVMYSFTDAFALDSGDYLNFTYTDAWGNTTYAPTYLVDDLKPFVMSVAKSTTSDKAGYGTLTLNMSEPIRSTTAKYANLFFKTPDVLDEDDQENGYLPVSKILEKDATTGQIVEPVLSADGKSMTFRYKLSALKGEFAVAAADPDDTNETPAIQDLSYNVGLETPKAWSKDASGDTTTGYAYYADDVKPLISAAMARIEDEDLAEAWVFFDEPLENEVPETSVWDDGGVEKNDVFAYETAVYTWTCNGVTKEVKWVDQCWDTQAPGCTANGDFDVVSIDGKTTYPESAYLAAKPVYEEAPNGLMGVKLTFQNDFFFAGADCECTVSVSGVKDDAGNLNDATQVKAVDVNNDLIGPSLVRVTNDDPAVPGNDYLYNTIWLVFSESLYDGPTIPAGSITDFEKAPYVFSLGGTTYTAQWVDHGDKTYQSDESELLSGKPEIVTTNVENDTIKLTFKDDWFFASVTPDDTVTVSTLRDLVGNGLDVDTLNLVDKLAPIITSIEATEGTTYDTITLHLSEALSATSAARVVDPTKYTVTVAGDEVFIVGSPVYDADALTITLKIPNDVLDFTHSYVEKDIEVTIEDDDGFVLEDVRDNRSGGTVTTPDIVPPYVTALDNHTDADGDPTPDLINEADTDDDGIDDKIQRGFTGTQALIISFNEAVVADKVFDPANWTVPAGWSIIDILNGDNAGPDVEGYTTQVVVRLKIETATETGDQVVLAAAAVEDEAGNVMEDDFVVEVGTTLYDAAPPYITKIELDEGDDVSDWVILTVSEPLQMDDSAADTMEFETGTFNVDGLGTTQVAPAVYDNDALTITIHLADGAIADFSEVYADQGNKLYFEISAEDQVFDLAGKPLASYYPTGSTGDFIDDDHDLNFGSDDDNLVDADGNLLEDVPGLGDAGEPGNIDTDPFYVDLQYFVAPRIIAHNFNTALNGTTSGDRILPVVLYFSKALNELTAENRDNYTLPAGFSFYTDPVYEEENTTTFGGTPGFDELFEEYKDSGATDTDYKVTIWMRGDVDIEMDDELEVKETIEDLYGNALVDPIITANDKTAPIETGLTVQEDLVDQTMAALTGPLPLADEYHYDQLTLTVNEAIQSADESNRRLQQNQFRGYVITDANDDGDFRDATLNANGSLTAGDDDVDELTFLGDPVVTGTTLVFKIDDSGANFDLSELAPNQKAIILPVTDEVEDLYGNVMLASTAWNSGRGVGVVGTHVSYSTLDSHTFGLDSSATPPLEDLGVALEVGETGVFEFEVVFDIPGTTSLVDFEEAVEDPANWAINCDGKDDDACELFTHPQFDGTDTVTVWVKLTRGAAGDGDVNAEDTAVFTSALVQGGSITLGGGDNSGPAIKQLLSVASADSVAYNVRVLLSEDIDVDQLQPTDLTVEVCQAGDEDMTDDCSAGNETLYTLTPIGLTYDATTDTLAFKIAKIDPATGDAIEISTQNGMYEWVKVSWAADLPIGLDGDAAGDTDDPADPNTYEDTELTVASEVVSHFTEADNTPPWIKAGSVTGWQAGAGDEDGDETTNEIIGVTFILKDNANLVDDEHDGPLPIDAAVLAELQDWTNYSVTTTNGVIGKYGSSLTPVTEGEPTVPVTPIARTTADNSEVKVWLFFAYDPADAGGLDVGDSFSLLGLSSIVDANTNTITKGNTVDGVNTVYAETGGYAIDNPRISTENSVTQILAQDFTDPWKLTITVNLNEPLYTAGSLITAEQIDDFTAGDLLAYDALNPFNYTLSDDLNGDQSPKGYDEGEDDEPAGDTVPVAYTQSGTYPFASQVVLTFGSDPANIDTGEPMYQLIGEGAGNGKPAVGAQLLLTGLGLVGEALGVADIDIGLDGGPRIDQGHGNGLINAGLSSAFAGAELDEFTVSTSGAARPAAGNASVTWDDGVGANDTVSVTLSNLAPLVGGSEYVLWLYAPDGDADGTADDPVWINLGSGDIAADDGNSAGSIDSFTLQLDDDDNVDLDAATDSNGAGNTLDFTDNTVYVVVTIGNPATNDVELHNVIFRSAALTFGGAGSTQSGSTTFGHAPVTANGTENTLGTFTAFGAYTGTTTASIANGWVLAGYKDPQAVQDGVSADFGFEYRFWTSVDAGANWVYSNDADAADLDDTGAAELAGAVEGKNGLRVTFEPKLAATAGRTEAQMVKAKVAGY